MVIKLVARKVGMRDYFPDLQSLLIQEWGGQSYREHFSLGEFFLGGFFPGFFFFWGGGKYFLELTI